MVCHNLRKSEGGWYGSKQCSGDSCLYAGFEEVTIRNEEEHSWGDGEVE